MTDEEIIRARTEAPYYCPGCGRAWQYPAECNGTATAPHPPIQTVSTDELKPVLDETRDTEGTVTGESVRPIKNNAGDVVGHMNHGDPEKHTPAPSTEG